MILRTVLEEDSDTARIGCPDASVDRSIGENFHADPAVPLHDRHCCRMALRGHWTRENDHPPTGSKADRRVICTGD
jgi:hypothetical protein